jgi:hypothetical protein
MALSAAKRSKLAPPVATRTSAAAMTMPSPEKTTRQRSGGLSTRVAGKTKRRKLQQPLVLSLTEKRVRPAGHDIPLLEPPVLLRAGYVLDERVLRRVEASVGG